MPKTEKRSEADAAQVFAVTHERLFQLEEQPLRLVDVIDVYAQIFTDDAFPNLKGNSRPHYDIEKYPPLSETLLANGPLAAPPAWQTPAELLAIAAADSPLAQFLAAYIWKKGEFDRVKLVRAGLTAAAGDTLPPDGGTDAAVMWEFGRHLARPDTAPIFDQHTYRAFRRLHALRGQGALAPAIRHNEVPGRMHLKAYLDWWQAAVFDRVVADDSRADTLYRIDLLLYSLGKAGPR
jgi:hypothetical protein